jgi:hypothetical protein
MYKGLVLAGGGSQVDPGYEGKLFGLLINFSEESVLLKFKEHWATIEFAPTSFDPGRSRRYKDQEDNYQGTTSIGQLFPERRKVEVERARAVTSALRRVWLDLQALSAQVPTTLQRVDQLEARFTEVATELRSTLQHYDANYAEQTQRLDERYLAISAGARDAYEAAADRIENRVNQYAILGALIIGLTLAAVVIAVFLK